MSYSSETQNNTIHASMELGPSLRKVSVEPGTSMFLDSWEQKLQPAALSLCLMSYISLKLIGHSSMLPFHSPSQCASQVITVNSLRTITFLLHSSPCKFDPFSTVSKKYRPSQFNYSQASCMPDTSGQRVKDTDLTTYTEENYTERLKIQCGNC